MALTPDRPLACTRCGMAFTGTTWDIAQLTECPYCGAELSIAIFPALSRSTETKPSAETIVAEGEAACFYHPAKRAIVPCDSCGRFLCALCDVQLDGKHFCPTCTEKPKTASLERKRARYDRIVWALVVIPVPLCMIVAPFTAIWALVLGIWKWRSPPSLVTNSRLWLALGLVVAILELVSVIAGWMAISVSGTYAKA